jgi:4-diphosphocytidyl-2C-methyl-D-erythritol kinase
VLASSLHNDLQVPALALSHELRAVDAVLGQLKEKSAIDGFLLSGSGSSFFAVVRNKQVADTAARAVRSAMDVCCKVVDPLPAWGFDCTVLTFGRTVH